MAWLRKSEVVIAGILLLAMILIGLVNPAFWQLDNLFGLLRSNVIIGIMALGVLLIMISGGIDVSFPAFAVAAMYLTIKGMVWFYPLSPRQQWAHFWAVSMRSLFISSA